MHVVLEHLVEAVQALSEAEFGKPSPFHLSACGICGGPSFQYPCPLCRYWADFSQPKAERERDIRAASGRGSGSRAFFVRAVTTNSGIGPWYFGEFKNVVAYKSEAAWKQHVDDIIALSRTIEWPDPGEVWDHISAGQTLSSEAVWTDKRDRVNAMANRLFGAECAARLISARRSQFTWPAGSQEGMRCVRASAAESLEILGLPIPAVAVEARPLPPAGPNSFP
jgi:hypothetical protein